MFALIAACLSVYRNLLSLFAMSKQTKLNLTNVLSNLLQNGFVDEALHAVAVTKKTFYDKGLWLYVANAKCHLHVDA